MAVVALYNLKGGVGKTTGAVNLAHLAARLGRRTLVWDLDGQGAATFLLGGEPAGHRALDAIVDGSRPLDDLVVPTAFEGLSLVPASPSYLGLDIALDATRKPARRLARLLEPLADQYDDVFLDCPPSMSTLSASIVRAADVVLVPLLPSPLAVRAFDQLSRFVAGTKHRPQVWAYFSMVDGRRSPAPAPRADRAPSRR
nr:AAA family ATPase [Acidimicrobiia bacterium]